MAIKFDNFFDVYGHLFSKKAKETLSNNISKDASYVKHDGQQISVEPLYMMARPKNKFFLEDTILAMVKELENMIRADYIVGAPKDNVILIGKNDNDELTIKFITIVRTKYASDARSWCGLDFSVYETELPKIYPTQFTEPTCTCGVLKIHGKNATQKMHSKYCEMSEVKDNGRH
jgi:hypothetical protein